MATTLRVNSDPATIQSGSKQVGPFSIVGTDTIDAITVVQLASGFNQITVPQVPVSVVGCVIAPPSGNTVELTLKGITGDTGIRISKTNVTVISFDTASIPATIGITTSAAMTGDAVLTITWF